MNVAAAWLTLVLACLATARLTRLVTADFITVPIRLWVIRRWGDESKPAYLIECDWCFSIYVAAAVAPVAIWWGDNRVVLAVLVALAASHVTGLLSNTEPRE